MARPLRPLPPRQGLSRAHARVLFSRAAREPDYPHSLCLFCVCVCADVRVLVGVSVCLLVIIVAPAFASVLVGCHVYKCFCPLGRAGLIFIEILAICRTFLLLCRNRPTRDIFFFPSISLSKYHFLPSAQRKVAAECFDSISCARVFLSIKENHGHDNADTSGTPLDLPPAFHLGPSRPALLPNPTGSRAARSQRSTRRLAKIRWTTSASCSPTSPTRTSSTSTTRSCCPSASSS